MDNIGNILSNMNFTPTPEEFDCRRKICWSYQFEGVCQEGKTHYDENICSSMKDRLEELAKRANIPPIFRGIYLPSALEFSKNNPTVLKVIKDYTDNLRENLRQGRGIILHGNIGVGKTSLSVAILMHAALSRFSCFFADFLNDILSFYDLIPNQQERFDYFEKIKNVDLLVVDDILEPKQNLRSYDYFIGLLNYRYNQCRSTIITSNITGKENNSIPARIKDRLFSKNEMIVFTGKSMRR